MKSRKYTIIYTWTIAIASFLFCFNGSVITNTPDSSTDPDVNFYGVLEDHVHTAQVEYILIGGKYESIPVYQTVTAAQIKAKEEKNQEIDPKQNKILLNLQDIKSITLEHPNNPTASAIQINSKNYIQIVVQSIQGTQKKYLVESTRKINCKEVDKSLEGTSKTFQSRDINFIHIKKLTISGYKSGTPYKAPTITPISDSITNTQKINASSSKSIDEKNTILKEKEIFKNNAAEILQAIEENVKNMPIDNPTAFETMKSTVLTLLKTLRDQLQKFLDMIK